MPAESPVVEKTLVSVLLSTLPKLRSDGNEPGSATLLVAFSGGPDSAALLAAAQRTSTAHGFAIQAVHVDHGADRQSGARARQAGRIAEQIGVPCRIYGIDGATDTAAATAAKGKGHEAYLRALRDLNLETAAVQTPGVRAILTAHHQNDQSETIALRMLRGSGILGLAGMSVVDTPAHYRTKRLRPLLDLPRSEILGYIEELGLEAIDDPTNRDMRQLRARLRHQVMPALRARDPEIDDRLIGLGEACARVNKVVSTRLQTALDLRSITEDGRKVGASLAIDELIALPPSLRPFALSMLQRTAGARYPGTRGARAELVRQLEAGSTLGIDCGGGWAWERVGGERLAMTRRHRS